MNKKLFLSVLTVILPLLAGAQALKGSYFLDNSLNRHELNPAFAPRANYFQLLAIGNIGTGMGSNLEIPTFLYPNNGELVTFLHPSVSLRDFDRALARHPHMDAEFNTTILGFGFYTKRKSYWTFDLDVRANIDGDLPRDMFMFIKKGAGTSGESYNVGNMNLYASAGIQASLGYSRDIFKGLRVGAKARVIAPLGYAAVNLEKMTVNTGADKWTLTTEGYAHAAVNGLDISMPAGEKTPVAEFDQGRFFSNGVVAGFGYSFDLGAEYVLELGTLFDGLSISAAVTDLGQIHYKDNAVSSFKSGDSVEWTGFQNVNVNNLELEESLNEFLKNAQESLLNLSEMKHDGGFTRSTMPRVHIGVEMPFLKRSMSVGLLYSARMSHSYTRNELTLSYNLNPCKWFAMGFNYSFLNSTRTLGFLMELTPRVGPAFYIGCDYIPLEFAPASFVPMINLLPTSLRLNLNFGIAFQVGGKTTKSKE
jgi:hypothetical protein